MKKTIEVLAAELSKWSSVTTPVHKGDWVPIFRMDQSNQIASLDPLFFGTESIEQVSLSGRRALPLLRQQVVSTGGLRNSLFTEVFRKHSKFDRIKLSFDVEGSFAYEISRTTSDGRTNRLGRGTIMPSAEAPDSRRTETPVSLSIENDLGRNARLHWSLRALSDDAVIHDAVWNAEAPGDSSGRMIVVLRTFGRTEDIKSLLHAFEKQCSFSPAYARLLKNVFFYVLDTSSNLSSHSYQEFAEFAHVRAHVVKGANLGGGGNMSQALLQLDQAINLAQIEVNELLLLDDDLTVSLESLLRHWATIVFRSDTTIFTLPVLMKSEPTRMWEDGAIWGRFLDDDISPDRTAIAPRLLRHNRDVLDTNFINEIASPNYPEYCTFIFFSLPYARFTELGYPAAFFLRGDDIEYSLRHRAKGGAILSNANLCAWHEPAHSYGQEYMSIAHGIIINMRYGATEPSSFARFFHQRLVSHASISDAAGLRLYAKVLADLNSKTMFLTHEFAARYVKRLGEFKAFDADFEYVAPELRGALRHAAELNRTTLGEYGFLYPPIEGRPRYTRVILENPHTQSARVYDPRNPSLIAECAAAAAEFAPEFSAFLADYDALRAHYLERFAVVSEPEFWQRELTHYPAPETLFHKPE